MTTGEKIAEQRKKAGLTQEQLGEMLGVSRQAISRWESEAAFPETESLIRMSNIFHCSIDYLLKNEEGALAETVAQEEPSIEEETVMEPIEAETVEPTKPQRNWWSRNWRKFTYIICFALGALFILSGITVLAISGPVSDLVREVLESTKETIETESGVTIEQYIASIVEIVKSAMFLSGIGVTTLGGIGLVPAILFLVKDIRFQKTL